MSEPTKDNSVKRAKLLTTLSSCCGVTGETAMTDSAIILLFASSLGASNTGALFSTSALPLFNGLAVIPMALIAPFLGVRRLALTACMISATGYIIAGCAPWLGGASTIIWGVTCAALVQSGFVAGWFPLLNSFLNAQDRIPFLGRMRFCHQLCATLFVLASGWFMGAAPSVGRIQAVVLTSAVIFCGRLAFILGVPNFQMDSSGGNGPVSSFQCLRRIAANSEIRRFAWFQCLFNLGSFAIIPVSIMHLKRLCLPDDRIVYVSGASFIGMMLGYWFVHNLVKRSSPRRITALFALGSLPATVLFFLLDGTPGPALCVLLSLSLMCVSFAVAAFSVVSSALMMQFSQNENAAMTMAFCNAFYYSSAGGSRLLVSWLAGTAWLASPHGLPTGFSWLFLGFAVFAALSACLASRMIPHSPRGET
ncbi:MAG: hypothetical protein J5746_03100 [Victivallales bacterium]|nr:hypothetical protein [Victivallales bacterium]